MRANVQFVDDAIARMAGSYRWRSRQTSGDIPDICKEFVKLFVKREPRCGGTLSSLRMQFNVSSDRLGQEIAVRAITCVQKKGTE